MWINRHLWNELQVARLSTEQALLDRIEALTAKIRGERASLADLRKENTTLRERLITAEATARSAATMSDLFTIRVNQLEHERTLYLQKLFDPTVPVQLPVPHVGRMPAVVGPGNLFEDQGDASADPTGRVDEDDTPIPLEDLSGLLGQVYDPAATLGLGVDSSPLPGSSES